MESLLTYKVSLPLLNSHRFYFSLAMSSQDLTHQPHIRALTAHQVVHSRVELMKPASETAANSTEHETRIKAVSDALHTNCLHLLHGRAAEVLVC